MTTDIEDRLEETNGEIPEGFNFDDDEGKRVEIPFRIGGVNYILRESSEGDAVTFRNALAAVHVFNGSGQLVAVKNPANLEPLLLSMCCWRTVSKGGKEVTEKVPKEVISTWQSRVCRKLFLQAKKISHLDEPVEAGQRNALEKALEVDGSPVTLVELRKWVDSLDKKEFKNLQEWLEPSAEELAKNEQSGTESITT